MRVRFGALGFCLLMACKGGGDKAELPDARSVKEAPATKGADAGPVAAAPGAGAVTASDTDAGTGTTAPPGLPETGEAPAGGAAWTGTTEPHRQGTLTPRVNGVVSKVHVREGDVVKKDDPLVSLDAADFNLRLRQAQAGYDAARAQHDAAKLEWERNKALVADNSIPQAQFDTINAQFEGAKAQLAQANVAVDMARKAQRDSVVRAPYDALVARRFVSEGEYATTMPATPLVTVQEVAMLDLRVQVPAADAARIQVGTPLTVRIAGIEQPLTVKVTRVVDSVDPRTRTFAIIAEIPNKDGKLRPGLFAHVSL